MLILFRSIFALLSINAIFVVGDDLQSNIVSYDSVKFPGKTVFDYRKNGVRIDVRVLPAVNITETNGQKSELDFPEFPIKEIGGCIWDLSLSCVQRRIVHFVEAVDRLDEITLFGKSVRIIRSKALPTLRATDRQLIGESIGDRIDRSIDDFFDTHALRITLPKWNGNLSQVNIMLDDTNVSEGRGKGGGGKGGKGGGKCKKMAMMMISMMKMKLMGMVGLTAMKGMMMAGMSLMLSKMMLIMKLMSLKKGGGFGGGGGGVPTKEIVLITKQGGCSGGSGCGGGGAAPIDSYGAPPASSYGAPSSGGGGYDYSSGGGGGGGGWGRSFDRRPTMPQDYDYPDNGNNYPEWKPLKSNDEMDDKKQLALSWIPETNLSNSAWNDTANRRPMTYVIDKTATNEGHLSIDERLKSSKNAKDTLSKINTLHRDNYRNWNNEHFAKIRSILHRNISFNHSNNTDIEQDKNNSLRGL